MKKSIDEIISVLYAHYMRRVLSNTEKPEEMGISGLSGHSKSIPSLLNVLKGMDVISQTKQNKLDKTFTFQYDSDVAMELTKNNNNYNATEFITKFDTYALDNPSMYKDDICYRAIYYIENDSVFFLYFNNELFTSRKDNCKGGRMTFALKSELIRFAEESEKRKFERFHSINLAWGIGKVLGIENSCIYSGSRNDPFNDITSFFETIESFTVKEVDNRIKDISEKIDALKSKWAKMQVISDTLKSYGVDKFQKDYTELLKTELLKTELNKEKEG